ncbi:hypothetical protein MBANPS3_008985 [Mucor bainieri]
MVKALFLLAVLCLVLIQTTYASISSPKSGQDLRAGQYLTVKYVMQPLIKNNVSAGKALKLNINFHKRTGNKKQQQVAIISHGCPVSAKESKYVTYTKKWKIPKSTKPGSYAVDFKELVQLRRGQITAIETVKVNVVD